MILRALSKKEQQQQTKKFKIEIYDNQEKNLFANKCSACDREH